MNLPAVALIGAEGHGRWHRRAMHRLAEEGRIRVAGLSARRPIVSSEDAPTEGVPTFTDYQVMLRETRPDVVIICTPPHTHLAMAKEVFAIGADLLLEKPPVPSVAEQVALAQLIKDTGRLCQVNFQALGSKALAEICSLVTSGELGAIESVDAVGAWWRPDSYFTRSPWAGKRSLDGSPIMDGALVNPFAHAVMQALAIAEAAGVDIFPLTMELERYRTRDIEVDDLACMRLTYADGTSTTVAVTLASGVFVCGEIPTRGSTGTALLEYPKDRVILPGETEWSEPRGRVGLLDNLLDHRDDPSVPLFGPLERTAAFTTIAEGILAAPLPERVDERYLTDKFEDKHIYEHHFSQHPEDAGAVRVVDGVAEVLQQVVREHKLPSELSVPWAAAPYRAVLHGGRP